MLAHCWFVSVHRFSRSVCPEHGCAPFEGVVHTRKQSCILWSRPGTDELPFISISRIYSLAKLSNETDPNLDCPMVIGSISNSSLQLFFCAAGHLMPRGVDKFSGNHTMGISEDDMTKSIHTFIQFSYIVSKSHLVLCDLQGMKVAAQV